MFLVVANWKMNGNSALVAEFNSKLKPSKAEVVICPPFHLISSIKGKRGGQTCHWAESGAHTGEVSATMLKDLGAEYVILGHSERREAGETSAQVAKKITAAQAAGLKVILCIGEKEGENRQQVIKQQLAESIPTGAKNIIIAYEPVWAIGTGKTPTTAQIAEAHALIKKISGFEVIYGGSVNPANAAEISKTPGVSGLLVGGASLDAQKFNSIITC